jgi:peptide/nickel transport system permease protein
MATQAGAVAEVIEGRARRNVLQKQWLLWKRRPLGLIGLGIVVLMLVSAMLAPVLATHDRFATSAVDQLASPSAEHWLGADRYGRDLWSRIVWGAQISLYVGFTVALSAGAVAGVLGVVTAYFGGKFDLISQRVVDVFQAFPGLILAMAIVSVLGFGIEKAIIAIAIPTLPRMIRVVRSQALSVTKTDYVLAGRTIGASNWRLISRYVMANSMAPWIIVVTGQLGSAITTEASLSFLGLGVPEPHPSWGSMLSMNAADYAEIAPWLVIFPGLALALAVFGFNVFGDALRDVLDPRLRGR